MLTSGIVGVEVMLGIGAVVAHLSVIDTRDPRLERPGDLPAAAGLRHAEGDAPFEADQLDNSCRTAKGPHQPRRPAARTGGIPCTVAF